jgi:hypothetical protein
MPADVLERVLIVVVLHCGGPKPVTVVIGDDRQPPAAVRAVHRMGGSGSRRDADYRCRSTTSDTASGDLIEVRADRP